MRKLLSLLILCLLLICSAAAAETTTIMMYMCGADIQSDCVTDMKEIVSGVSGSDINVVVLAGGAKSWPDSKLTGGKLNLFTIRNGSRSDVTDWGRGNMGSADTLVKFVKYCRSSYPADRTVLVLWDHGSSAISGICFDQVYNDDGLTLKEIETALSTLKSADKSFRLDLIGADACLMGSYEMAATVAPYADYFVGSEELEPWLGWYYTNWLRELSANPSMSDRDLAISIVKSYQYGCEKEDPNDYLTLSAIDLSAIGELTQAINGMAASLKSAITGGSFSSISRTIQSMYVFGNFDGAGSDMVDLTDFIAMAEAVDPANAALGRAALQKAVAANYASASVPSATGLSIFLPMENSGETSAIRSDYSTSALTGYLSFVTAFAETVSGGNYVFTASGSSPYQQSTDDADFLASAYGYSYGNEWTNWLWDDDGWWDDYDTDCWGWGYGYGSGFGFNNSCGDIVIAGSAGVPVSGIAGTGSIVIAGSAGGSAAATSTPSGGGIVIAGGNATPTPTATTGGIVIAGGSTAAPAATPAPTVSGVVIAGTTSISAPASFTSASAYSLSLSSEDIRNLSYAELFVLLDLSDEEDTILMSLGCVRDTWIDWARGRVHSLFDGSWPVIGDLIVSLHDQAVTERIRRSVIPVLLNGEETYLVVEFENGSQTGTILGSSKGWTENGLPVRGITPLQNGDVIIPGFKVYLGDAGAAHDLSALEQTMIYPGEDDEELRFRWDGTQTVTYDQLADEGDSFLLSFRLHDIYGDHTDTELMPVSVN